MISVSIIWSAISGPPRCGRPNTGASRSHSSERDYSISWQEGLNNMEQYFDWIHRCRLIVTNDSFGPHLAIAMKKKIVALFSSTRSSGVVSVRPGNGGYRGQLPVFGLSLPSAAMPIFLQAVQSGSRRGRTGDPPTSGSSGSCCGAGRTPGFDRRSATTIAGRNPTICIHGFRVRSPPYESSSEPMIRNHSFQARQQWQQVRDRFDGPNWKLGRHWSYNLCVDPKRLGFVLSRYKFAAKMACAGHDVLELGCSEGIGTAILAESARSYTGVDLDAEAIRSGQGELGTSPLFDSSRTTSSGKYMDNSIPWSVSMSSNIFPSNRKMSFLRRS